MFSLGVGEVFVILFLGLFYALVISLVVLASIKIFAISREMREIRELLFGIKESLDKIKQ